MKRMFKHEYLQIFRLNKFDFIFTHLKLWVAVASISVNMQSYQEQYS